MSTKHTPGPWFIPEEHDREDEPIEVCVDDRATGNVCPRVCEVVTSCTTAEQALADAHLISAAPELLAAIQGLLDAQLCDPLRVVGKDKHGHDMNALGMANERAQEAIAKARGAK